MAVLRNLRNAFAGVIATAATSEAATLAINVDGSFLNGDGFSLHSTVDLTDPVGVPVPLVTNSADVEGSASLTVSSASSSFGGASSPTVSILSDARVLVVNIPELDGFALIFNSSDDPNFDSIRLEFFGDPSVLNTAGFEELAGSIVENGFAFEKGFLQKKDGFGGTISTPVDANSVTASFSSIPEPATALLAMLGFGLCARRSRPLERNL